MKHGRTAPLNGCATNITEDDVMLKALMKEMFGEARRQSEDSVQHQNCIAYFYVNRSREGRKFVKLSLHRLAKVDGKKRAFNSFNAEDLLSFPGLLQKAARWLCHEQSTAHETRQVLNEFAAILDVVWEMWEHFGRHAPEVMQALADFAREHKEPADLTNRLRVLSMAKSGSGREASGQGTLLLRTGSGRAATADPNQKQK